MVPIIRTCYKNVRDGLQSDAARGGCVRRSGHNSANDDRGRGQTACIAPCRPTHTGHRWTSDDLTAWLLVAPAVLAILVMFVVPVGYVLLLSLTDPTVSFAHYQRMFTVPLYTGVMINTFKTSLIVTVACLLLGYPLAYVMARRNDWVALIFLVAVGMSFWTGFVVRTYAWLVILGNKGPSPRSTRPPAGAGRRSFCSRRSVRPWAWSTSCCPTWCSRSTA